MAMELTAEGNFNQAISEFRKCIDLDVQYLPAYVDAGKTFRAAGKLAEARDIFQAGLAIAIETAQTHVADYITQQLETLHSVE